ncbi:Alpha/Beta hydrolase protein [Halenospora varia]|nr:Alpha/Beta hydrolase protein [Halenospora varia]
MSLFSSQLNTSFRTIMFAVISFAIITLSFLAKSHFTIREHLSNILETKNTPRDLNSQGFYDLPTKRLSAEGKATCHERLLKIPVLATNKKINYTGPKDNFELIALLVDFFQVNPNFTTCLVGEDFVISDTFNTAASRGFATFSYDRLGTGRSQHPNPIQTVQQSLQVELAHTLITYLRTSKIHNIPFRTIIGIGHSLGSALTQAVSARYPEDFEALILTGHSSFFGETGIGIASTAQIVANTEGSGRFRGLENGYYTEGEGVQTVAFGFYYFPYFDQEIVKRAYKERQANALGELLTIFTALAPATAYTRPVYILNGRHDFFYCQGDCAPQDVTAQALPIFYPNASVKSKTENIPNTGHNINLHFGAEGVFRKMLDFLEGIGLSP